MSVAHPLVGGYLDPSAPVAACAVCLLRVLCVVAEGRVATLGRFVLDLFGLS